LAKVWRKYRVKPWRAESFRFSTDPLLVGKVTDVVGLYLNQGQNAVVLCVDEREPDPDAGLDRPDPAATAQAGGEPLPRGLRHGTPFPFAALEVGTGQVTAAWQTPAIGTRSSSPSSGRSPATT
jgi:hypothetical protein